MKHKNILTLGFPKKVLETFLCEGVNIQWWSNIYNKQILLVHDLNIF